MRARQRFCLSRPKHPRFGDFRPPHRFSVACVGSVTVRTELVGFTTLPEARSDRLPARSCSPSPVRSAPVCGALLTVFRARERAAPDR